MNRDAGSCAGTSVHMERITHRSSAQEPRLANSSLISRPERPYFSNLNGVGKARPLKPGSVWSAKRASVGLGSKVSTCEGPPPAKMWTTCFAFTGKCGCRGAKGERITEDAA